MPGEGGKIGRRDALGVDGVKALGDLNQRQFPFFFGESLLRAWARVFNSRQAPRLREGLLESVVADILGRVLINGIEDPSRQVENDACAILVSREAETLGRGPVA